MPPAYRRDFANMALFELDAELREIMLDALLKVEVKIRSALACEFCAAYGESQGKCLDACCYATSKGAGRVLEAMGFRPNGRKWPDAKSEIDCLS